MTVSLFAAGLQTGVVGTEVFLTNVNEVGRFVLHVDLASMVSGTMLELRGYQTVLTGGSGHVAYFGNYQGAQPTDALVTISDPPLSNELTDAQALRFSLKQTVGPALTFPWKVLNISKFPANFPALGIDSLGQVQTVINLVSGTSGGAGASAADVWAFTGSRSLNGLQQWNLIGNISGTITNNYIQGQTILDMVAMLKEDERAIMGNIYYVDGTQGNDVSGLGTRISPFKTITRALIPVVDHNHDGIFLLPLQSGTNTVTETGTVIISKADVQIWGPGYDAVVTNIPATNRDVFDIRAEGVGLHQFRVSATGNSSNGVTFSNGAALGLLSRLWIESVPQDGVFINVGNRNRIVNSYIQTVGRDGVRISSGAGSGTYNRIEDTMIRNNAGNGINLLGVDASNNIIRRNIIRDNIGFGISIGAGAANTEVNDNRIFNNTAGAISDAGTNLYQQWNWFNTDANGIPLAVYNLVSGTVVADRVWQYTGTRIVDYVRGLVGVSGTVIASAVQGGFVSVSGAVIADVRSLVGVSGTVLASAVQGLVGISGTVEAVRGGFVTVSGSVTVGTVLDKTGYSLSSPQNFNLIGNISGTITNVYNVISGTPASFDPSLVWSFTGTRSLNGIQLWNLSGSIGGNLLGYVGMVTGSVMSVVSGTSASFDPALVWAFTGSRSLNGLQNWNLVGNISGTLTNVFNVISGTQATINAADVWNFTGSRSLNGLQTWNLNGYVGMVTGSVMSVISGTAASFDPALVWQFTGSRTLTDPQNWNLIGNISGTIVGLNVTVTGVTIDVASVWGYPVRTLTSQVFNLPPVEQGNNLTMLRGDTFTWNPTALGSLLNHSKIYFSVKRKYTDLDSEALVQVSDVGGLLVINGTPAVTAANGSITINNVNTGDITIVVKAIETAKLDVLTDIYYDVQLVRTDGSVETLVYGLFTIPGDSTRATS